MAFSNDETLTEIRSLFEQYGTQPYYGEAVSQFQHAAQSAELARRDGFNEEVQIAAFLHDIGHMLPTDDPVELMDEYGRMDHEGVAADWLRERGFSERIAMLIENARQRQAIPDLEESGLLCGSFRSQPADPHLPGWPHGRGGSPRI